MHRNASAPTFHGSASSAAKPAAFDPFAEFLAANPDKPQQTSQKGNDQVPQGNRYFFFFNIWSFCIATFFFHKLYMSRSLASICFSKIWTNAKSFNFGILCKSTFSKTATQT